MEPAGNRREYVGSAVGSDLINGRNGARLYRREHPTGAGLRSGRRRCRNGAAMDWRERIQADHELDDEELPQWSPPVTGGNGVVQRTRRAVVPLAAMEPATDWREHRRATDHSHRA